MCTARRPSPTARRPGATAWFTSATTARTGREADSLAQWWAPANGRAGGIDGKRKQIAEYLDEPLDRAKSGEDAGVAFIEIKTSRFLVALDLPVPDELRH